MAKIVCSEKQTALTLGLVFVAMHAVWLLIVGVGQGQAVYNWLTGLHGITSSASIGMVSLGTMITGLIWALVLGAAIGWVFAATWNWLGKKL